MNCNINGITIDGSYGEGGGQILRTSCALSVITGIPCHVINIRKNRKKPGLKLQHLIGLRNLNLLCGGRLQGDAIGSQEIFFYPTEIRSKILNVQIATAGSITLVLQTLLLPAFLTSGPVKINFHGGATDTFFSPTIDYHRFVFLKILEKIELKTRTKIKKRGFYPKGDAKATIEVTPGIPLRWNCSERGSLNKIIIISGASLTLKDARVAERQAATAEELISTELKVPVDKKIEYYSTLSTGSQINVIGDCEHTTIGSDALGRPGKRAEIVGKEVAAQFLKEINSGACLDRFAGDQILPYLSIAEGTSTITVSEVSEHAKSNMWVIEKFLMRRFEIKKGDSKAAITIV